MKVQLDDREIATVLAALRNWQLTLQNSVDPAGDYPDFWDIATNGGRETPLDEAEVGDLCETINLGG